MSRLKGYCDSLEVAVSEMPGGLEKGSLPENLCSVHLGGYGFRSQHGKNEPMNESVYHPHSPRRPGPASSLGPVFLAYAGEPSHAQQALPRPGAHLHARLPGPAGNWAHHWSVPPVYEEKAMCATVRSPQGSYLLPAGTERWDAGHTGLRICGVGEWMLTLNLLLSSLPQSLIKVFNEQTMKRESPFLG